MNKSKNSSKHFLKAGDLRMYICMSFWERNIREAALQFRAFQALSNRIFLQCITYFLRGP